MFRSQDPHGQQPLQASLPNLCVHCVEIPAPPARNTQQMRAPLSPFPATLTDHSQLIENSIALSPVFATLTGTVNHKPFVCHSYRKQVGVGHTTSSLRALRYRFTASPSCPVTLAVECGSSAAALSSPAQERPQPHSPHTFTSRFSASTRVWSIGLFARSKQPRKLRTPFFLAPETGPQHPSVTLIGVPSWECPSAKGGVTRVKTLGR